MFEELGKMSVRGDVATVSAFVQTLFMNIQAIQLY